MQAIAYTRYGPPEVLQLQETPEPVLRDGEVRLRVRAASVNPIDWHFMRGTPYVLRAATGLKRPRVAQLGIDVAGTVEAVGSGVHLLQAGDEVFGSAQGAFAEVARALEKALVHKPGGVTFEQAAAVPVAGITALQALRDRGRLQPGQRVLINGAGGGVGTFAVQIAKELGADVTGVCSGGKAPMVRALGADRVIDYVREDFAGGGLRYDVILDMIANRSLSDLRRALTPRGRLVLVGAAGDGRWLGPLAPALRALLLSPFVRQKLLPYVARVSRDDLLVLQGLLASGKVTPVIDRSYALSEVPQAIAYLEQGHARGKVVISVA